MMIQRGAHYIQLGSIHYTGIFPKSIIIIYDVLLFLFFFIFNLKLRNC